MAAETRSLLEAAVRDGLARIREITAAGKSIPRLREYPELGYFDSGLPQFSQKGEWSDTTPADHAGVLHGGLLGPFTKRLRSSPPNPEPDPPSSWFAFLDHAEADERIRRHFGFHQEETSDATTWREWRRWEVGLLICHLVDRLIHLSGSTEFDAATFDRLYGEWISSVEPDRLPIDLIVPLVLLPSDVESVALSDQISVRRLDTPLQLARNTQRSFTSSAHEVVIGAATHALFLSGWFVPNATRSERDNTLFSADAFAPVLDSLEMAVAALRVASGASFGYAQLIARPVGWSDRWTAGLPTVYVSSVRAYPDHFENYGWLRPPDRLDESHCTKARVVLQALTSGSAPQLAFAARRLNLAFIRSSTEDAIVDATIGLEALVSDKTSTEISYKFRMRLAALAAAGRFEELSPRDVSSLTKEIYTLRSKVVHGHSKPRRNELARPGAIAPMEKVQAGLRLLRLAIAALAENPELRDAAKLDDALLDLRP